MPVYRTVIKDGESCLEALHSYTLHHDFTHLKNMIDRSHTVDKSSEYCVAYVKPSKLPFPQKFRGPRLRRTHKRPRLVPRRYRVVFDRLTP